MPGGKKLGGLKESARRPHRPGIAQPWCPYRCVGEYRGHPPHWCHSPGCPGVVVLWMTLGYDETDWACPFGCTPTRLVHTLTHDHKCPFWKQVWGKRGLRNDWENFVPPRRRKNPRGNVSEVSASRALRQPYPLRVARRSDRKIGGLRSASVDSGDKQT